MAGPGKNLVQVYRTGLPLYWVKFTFETGFELPSSWVDLPCYGLNLNLTLASGHRISTVFNGQNTFQKVAGIEVLDEYYNSYLRK
jgi:hypothetical protein